MKIVITNGYAKNLFNPTGDMYAPDGRFEAHCDFASFIGSAEENILQTGTTFSTGTKKNSLCAVVVADL